MIKLRGGTQYDPTAVHIDVNNEIKNLEAVTILEPEDVFIIELALSGEKRGIQGQYISGNDIDTYHKNIAAEINTTPVIDAVNLLDNILLEDQSDAWKKKSGTVNQLATSITMDMISDGVNFKKLTTSEQYKLGTIEENADVTGIVNVTTAENSIPVAEHSDLLSTGTQIDNSVSISHVQGTDTTLGPVTADINLGGFNIINSNLVQTNPSDLITKSYADGLIHGGYFFDAILPDPMPATSCWIISDGTVDFKGIYHFLMQAIDTVTGVQEFYRIKFEIPYNCLPDRNTNHPILEIQSISSISRTIVYDIYIEFISANLFKLWIYLDDTTDLEIKLCNLLDATIDIQNTPTTGIFNDIIDGTYVPINQKTVNTSIFKSHFFNATYNKDYSLRRVNEIKESGSFNFNFNFPEDFNSFPPIPIQKDHGIFVLCIPQLGADTTDQNISAFIEYDNGLETDIQYNTVSHIGNNYDLTGMYNKLYALKFLQNHSFPINEHPITAGIRIEHNNIGGKINYIGVRIIYR